MAKNIQTTTVLPFLKFKDTYLLIFSGDILLQVKKNELTRTRHGGPFTPQNMGGGDRRLAVGHSCLRSKLLALLYLYLPHFLFLCFLFLAQAPMIKFYLLVSHQV